MEKTERPFWKQYDHFYGDCGEKQQDSLFSIDNGMSWVFAVYMEDEEIEYYYDQIVACMDDEVREILHSRHAPCSKRVFLIQYELYIWEHFKNRKVIAEHNGWDVKEHDIIIG